MWVRVNTCPFPNSLICLETGTRIWLEKGIGPDDKLYKVMVSSTGVDGVLCSFKTKEGAEKKLHSLMRHLEAKKIEEL